MSTKMKAVYTIIEDEKLDKAIFRRVGVGFVNRDASLNVVLDALPVSGRLHIRDWEARREPEVADVEGGKEVA